MIEPTATVVVASDVMSSALGSEYVLLNLKDGMYYGLDGVGGDVWKLLQQPVRVAEICRVITEIYDVDQERCAHDVLSLLTDLTGRGLVEVRA